ETLATLTPKPVNIPAMPLWSKAHTGRDAGLGLLSMQFHGNHLLVCSQNTLNGYGLDDTRVSVWTHIGSISSRKAGGMYRAGDFRPPILDGHIYTRFSYVHTPSHFARLNAGTGEVEWGVTPNGMGPGKSDFPLSDPVLSGGLLYGLSYRETEDASMFLSCMDAETGALVWRKGVPDIGRFYHGRKKRMNDFAFGNRVTIHEGSIYASPSDGTLLRCDMRNGELIWVHHYGTSDGRQHQAGGWGAAPLVFGDLLIGLPRDSNYIIALDRQTGRLLWRNAMVAPQYPLGRFHDQLIVLGHSTLAAVDAFSGRTTWSMVLEEKRVGRPSLVGSSVLLGTISGLVRIDARTGIERERRPWPEMPYTVKNFALHEGGLYMITDEPSRIGPTYERGRAFEPRPESENLTYPGEPVWQLERSNPRLHRPPLESKFRNRLLVYADQVLECLNTAEGGRIEWQAFVGSHLVRVRFHEEQAILFFAAQRDRLEVTALDLETGHLLWQSRLPFGMKDQTQAGRYLMLSERNRLGVTDLRTGETLWNKIINTMGIGYGPHQMGVLKGQLHVVHQQERGNWLNWAVFDPRTGESVAPIKRLTDPLARTHETFDIHLRESFFGHDACYVGMYKRLDQGGVNQVYRWDVNDRRMTMLADNASARGYRAPYALIRASGKNNGRNYEMMALHDRNPEQNRYFDFADDRVVLLDTAVLRLDNHRKIFQVYDLTSGEQRVSFEESEGDWRVSTLTWDENRHLYLLWHEHRRKEYRVDVLDMDSWRRLGAIELGSIKVSRWNDRWPGRHHYRRSHDGEWLTRFNGRLILCGDDGIHAFGSMKGAE
ncbi:MAG: PQQ-binding-like beta-propeller repeat protein, partial [Verrucomicrobiota bacterium]